MAAELAAFVIQALFVLALTGLAFKFLIWPILRPIRWAFTALAFRRARHHRRVLGSGRSSVGRRGLRQPPPPDPVEVTYVHQSAYSPTPLSDELHQAIATLLILYGSLGVPANDLAAQLQRVNTATHLRPLVRIKTTIDDLAHWGVDGDLAATAYLMDLSSQLHGLVRAEYRQ